MVLMIIKGLFRRYERWNPVHPTLGTFWGMGIGIGCGVGWGPGFGPEVIGYVGAGCGVGFSVGITLAGIGVGLPVNAPIQIPYNAFAMSSGAIESARSIALTNMKSMAGDNWNFVGSHLSCLRGEACGRLSSLKAKIPLGQGARLTEMNNTVLWHIQSTLKHLDAFRQSCWPPGKNT